MNRTPAPLLPSLRGMLRVWLQVALYLSLFVLMYMGLFTVPAVVIGALIIGFLSFRYYRSHRS